MPTVKHSSRKAVNINFLSLFILLDEGIKLRSTDYEADALITILQNSKPDETYSKINITNSLGP